MMGIRSSRRLRLGLRPAAVAAFTSARMAVSPAADKRFGFIACFRVMPTSEMVGRTSFPSEAMSEQRPCAPNLAPLLRGLQLLADPGIGATAETDGPRA